jgi:hypothetical protein
MKRSAVAGSREPARVLNAVPLQNAVLCAECDVVSDSPNDTCMVCGSHSLFNVARIFGGNLPKQRASLVAQPASEASAREVVLVFPKPHRPRRRATASQQLSVVAFENNEGHPDRTMLVGPRGD